LGSEGAEVCPTCPAYHAQPLTVSTYECRCARQFVDYKVKCKKMTVELCLKQNEKEFTVVTGMRLRNQARQVGRTYCRYPVTSSKVSARLSVKVDPKESGECCTIQVGGRAMPNALGEGPQNALSVVSGHGRSEHPPTPEPHGSKEGGSGGTPTPKKSQSHWQNPYPHPQFSEDPPSHDPWDHRISKTGSGYLYMGHPGID
jgi:hypothetical protein